MDTSNPDLVNLIDSRSPRQNPTLPAPGPQTNSNQNQDPSLNTPGVGSPSPAPSPNANSNEDGGFGSLLPFADPWAIGQILKASNISTRALIKPTDIFFPTWNATGPQFLDDAGCLCTLRTAPDNSGSMWRCTGNGTIYGYTGNSGKWFKINNGGASPKGAIWDATNPPYNLNDISVATATAGQDDQQGLVPLAASNAVKLSVYDQACTAKNATNLSTALYRTVDNLQNNRLPIDAIPCYRPLALPVTIVNASTWLKDGCQNGFYCPNNTINSLPQWCQPVDVCQATRLSGVTCSLNGLNVPMGPFEPVICTAGYYCPKGGKEQIKCPAGSFCPLGSVTPIQCLAGSRCREGATTEYALIPIILTVLVDAALIIACLMALWVFRMKRHRRSEQDRVLRQKNMPGSLQELKGYSRVNPDVETVAELPIAGAGLRRQGTTGFESALNHSRASAVIDIDASPELQAFVESMKKAIAGANFGLTFTYRSLKFHPKKAPRPILEDISGCIKAGQLCAVMGGSGAGKSTFVNVLMGKTSHTGGQVYVNGIPGKMKQYKKIIGYVPQDDVVLPELTVRENILHSARIRLPKTWTNLEIEKHVDAVIDCLEIAHVRDSQVGTVAKPVISGGQRKRVSIGMELAAAPMSLFLDEPTSGLDATSAGSIMKMLKAISRLGISVIVIIHQPRVEIFEMIDNLVLLGDGHTIYEGPQSRVHDYFTDLGYHIPAGANMSDVVTDIITGHGRAYKASGDTTKGALISTWHNIHAEEVLPSPQANSLQETSSLHDSIKLRGAPFFRQLWFCHSRAMLQQWRTLSSFWFEMIVAVLGGFLIGLAQNGRKGVLFKGLYNGDYQILSTAVDYKAAPEFALLSCIAIGLIASSPAVKVFAEEKLMYRRESEAGHSSFAYYLAKVFSTFPRIILGCLHFSVLLMLLSSPVMPFGVGFIINILYFFAVYGLASIVAMLVRREDAPLIAVMASLIIGILSGAAPPLAKVKSWHMEWLWRMSPGTWAVEAYWGQNIAPLAHVYQLDPAVTVVGFTLKRLPLDLGVLFAIGLAYRVIAFFGLLVSPRLLS